jgi:tRNA nucleotidyltransferase (CCA-adding enzyme)
MLRMIEAADTFIHDLGIEAYRVGGSVRDEVLGRRIKDADYMVRGVTLRELGKLLARTDADASPLKLRDGRQAGWRAAKKGMGLVEIMLPRTDISTGPAHTDFEIVLDPNLSVKEDATRRDFTFNALYKIVRHPDNLHTSVTGENGVTYADILDPTGWGLSDLQRRYVRTTYPFSFRDDPLRTLRALRFVSVLGYDLALGTQEQMEQYASDVTGLTADGHTSGTVLDEMSKLLMGSDVRKALRLARDTGVLGTLFPELQPMIGFEQGSRYHDLTVDEHTFAALATAAHVNAPLRVRWALLFHDAGKPNVAWIGQDGRKHYYRAPWFEEWHAKANADYINPDYGDEHADVGARLWREAAKRMNAPVRLREDVATLIREHMVSLDGKFKASKVRQGRVTYGDEMLRDLFMHRACDESGKAKLNKQRLARLAAMEEARRRAQEIGVPASLKDLRVHGHDAKALGLGGRALGDALRTVLHEVASQPTEKMLSREWQLARLEALARG